MMTRYAIVISSLVILSAGTPRVGAAADPERLTPWEGLSVIIGQNVRVVMPDSARIEGKATSVAVDALEIEISKTSNKSAYPKGKFLVARATLKAVDVVRPTKQWRIVCVSIAAAVGTLFGIGAVNSAKSSGFGGASAGLGAAAVGMPLLGYFIGNAADRRVITYVITP
jgi:hypothetical protein